jgi:thiol-disulfide isomerase/thioredoxin
MILVDTLSTDEEGYFKERFDIETSGFYLIQAGSGDFITLILHPGDKVKITGNLSDIRNTFQIEGSEDSRHLFSLNVKLTESKRKLDSIQQVFNDSIESTMLNELVVQLDSAALNIFEQQKAYNKAFIESHPGSMASLVALYQTLTNNRPLLDIVTDFPLFQAVDSLLYKQFPETEPARLLHAEVIKASDFIRQEKIMEEKIGLGALAPEIVLPGPSGDSISLSSTRGKVVLLDFWAAWCQPCRDENPNLVQNYRRYRSRGFEIFQVSLDRSKDDWLGGIRNDGLGSWIHVSDLKFWNSVVVPQYYINSIPQNLLLDREGRIIAKNLRGKALGDKLKELFENK